MAALHSIIWQKDQRRVDVPLEKLKHIQQDEQTFIWLDMQDDPTEHYDTLIAQFNLSRITLDAICEPHERAKLTEGHGYFYMAVHGLTYDSADDTANTPKLDIVFAPRFLLTIHQAQMPWLESLRQATNTGKTEDNLMARGMPYLLHAILDALVDSYFPILDEIDDVVDDLENAAVQSTSDDVQARIFRLKRSLAQMRRVISPQVEVANSLITRTGEMIPRETEPYYADVHDHLVRAFEVLDSYRDLVSGLLDVHLSTVSNRLNSVMKQLTIIATIFMPITFITGIFGMNFGHSPQVEHDGGFNFWLVLIAMAIISTVQVWYFRRRGWI